MLALTTTNVASVVLFAVLYVIAAARTMSQGAFVLCLVLVFGLVTVVWVRVEARHGALEPKQRVGRIAVALAVVVVGVAAFSLVPAYWLETSLPGDAPFAGHLAPLMALTLVPLTLVVLVNVAGGAFVVAAGVLRSRSGAPRR